MRFCATILAVFAMIASQQNPVHDASSQERAVLATATTSNGYEGIVARKIEIGAVVIGIWPSGKWALADWRTTSAPAHGRILFVYRCDEWNVANVVTGSSAHEFGELMRVMDHSHARELITALAHAEAQPVVYMRPGHKQRNC